MRTNALDKIPITPGTCEWCGKDCEEEDVACSMSCEAQLHRLEAYQGRTVLRILKRWRKHSGRKGSPGEGLFSEVSETISSFLRTDRQRRERFQAARRLAEATVPPEDPKPGRQRHATAAPVTNEPEDTAQYPGEDWTAREGRLAQYGDLSDGVPNSTDPGKRGFSPK